MKKTKKRLAIILGIGIPVCVLVGAIVFVFFFGIPTFTKKPVYVTVDNSYRNNRNGYGVDVAGGDGTLFFTSYNRSPFNHGIYQINGNAARRVYREGFSILNPSIPFAPYVYRGKIIDTKNGKICSLNFSNGKFEPFLNPPLKDNEKLKEVFTSGGVLYYTDKSNNIYHYIDDNTIDIVASKKLCGKNYVYDDFCGNTMYYIDKNTSQKTVPNDYEEDEFFDCGIRKIYEYDLSERKTKRCIDFSCLDDVLPKKNCALEDYFVAENQVYLIVNKLEDLEDHYSKKVIEEDSMLQDIGYAENMMIYRYDINTKKLKKLEEFGDSSIDINGYGSNVFIKVTKENNYGYYGELVERLYSFSKDSDEPKLFATKGGDSINDMYIFDEEWLYYTTPSNRLYRIHPDGSDNECVF